MGTQTRIRNAGNSTRRLLVVDDDPTIRNILVQVFKLQGYDVEAACNGADALDHCTGLAKPFDVVITDLMMPVMTGKELITHLRDLYSQSIGKIYGRLKSHFAAAQVDKGIRKGDLFNDAGMEAITFL